MHHASMGADAKAGWDAQGIMFEMCDSYLLQGKCARTPTIEAFFKQMTSAVTHSSWNRSNGQEYERLSYMLALRSTEIPYRHSHKSMMNLTETKLQGLT